MTQLGAVVLTGGSSSRMGEDKASLRWDGVRAVDRITALGRAVGAIEVVTVGRLEYGPANIGDNLLSGPVGGVLLGVAALRTTCQRVLVLAVDAPTIEPDDLRPLLVSPSPGAAFEGLHLPLVLDVDALPADLAANSSVTMLIAAARLLRLPCPDVARLRLRGANTPEERDLLLRRPAPSPSRERMSRGG